MIGAIVNGLFNLITSLANLITAPLISAISALIPRLWQYSFIYENVFE